MKQSKKLRSIEDKKARVGFLFILPWIIGLVYFFFIPLGKSFIYTFHKLTIRPGGLEMKFVGLDNYRYAFTVDPQFPRALVESVSTLFFQVPLVLVLSVFFGCVLNQKFKGRTLVRAVMFLPVIIASGVVMNILNGDYLAQTLLSGEKSADLFQTQALFQFLLESGISANFASDMTAAANNIFELSWKSGIQILLILAGLQGIPSALYEASSIEGATAWESFWKITFPMLTPVLIINVVYTVIDAFTDVSASVMQLIINQSSRLVMEYASTMAWIYSIFVLAVVGIVFAIAGKKVVYTVN